MSVSQYIPAYTNCYAVIVGIDKYQAVSPLSCAVSDAQELSKLLQSNLGFQAENIAELYDEKATRENIRAALSSLTGKCQPNDKVIFYYAGHGETVSGITGEHGYLIPYDAGNDVSSYISWTDLKNLSELLSAKHVLFILDACFSGLAATRAPVSTSARFLDDILTRPSRQVIAAGKANQAVSDTGGPLLGHSVFTGHLIEGIQKGNIVSQSGILTANTLMNYLYIKVSQDPQSAQTPHYTQFFGDGDMILSDIPAQVDQQIVGIGIPPQAQTSYSVTSGNEGKGIIEISKELLRNKDTIGIDDLTTHQVQKNLDIIQRMAPVANKQLTYPEVFELLANYEKLMRDFLLFSATILRLNDTNQEEILHRLLIIPAQEHKMRSGYVLNNYLGCYPLVLQFYTSSIALIYCNKLNLLNIIFSSSVNDQGESSDYIQLLSKTILTFNQSDVFKKMPEHERNYVAKSEYLFNTLKPLFAELGYLGNSYEECFDMFEILFALCEIDHRLNNGREAWAQLGRFAWKEQNHLSSNPPLSRFIHSVQRDGQHSSILQSGLFGRSESRFKAAADHLLRFVKNTGWF